MHCQVSPFSICRSPPKLEGVFQCLSQEAMCCCMGHGPGAARHFEQRGQSKKNDEQRLSNAVSQADFGIFRLGPRSCP